MPSSQTRVVGSGFSVLRWQGQKIAFLEGVEDSGTQVVGAVTPIQPLDEPHPIEFALPRALAHGEMYLTIRELWNKPVWQHLKGFETANNLLDVWTAMSLMPGTITAQTIIKPPQGNYWRLKTFHNIAITGIDDTESISIGAMTVPRRISCYYTHSTRSTVASHN